MLAQQLLVEARRRSGFSRREIARRAGTSQATLAAYESGRVCPSVAVLERILLAAGFAIDAQLMPTDEIETGRVLEELLEIAEQYQWRDRGPLVYPVLARAAT